MLELNKVLVVGRLTRDPETRQLASGGVVANSSIAVNRRRKDPSNPAEYIDETSFIDVTAWDKQAEFIQRFFAKGKAIFVEGRLEQQRWQQDDGQKRSKLIIVAERVSFAESRAEEQGRQGAQPAQQQQPYDPTPHSQK